MSENASEAGHDATDGLAMMFALWQRCYPLGGNGSVPRGTASDSRQLPSRPWTRNSSPPLSIAIRRAATIASSRIRWMLLARLELAAVIAQPSGCFTTYRSFLGILASRWMLGPIRRPEPSIRTSRSMSTPAVLRRHSCLVVPWAADGPWRVWGCVNRFDISVATDQVTDQVVSC